MKFLQTTNFLRHHQMKLGSTEAALAKLHEETGIIARDYPEEGVVLLDYDQINSPKSHPLVIECRGLILYRDTLDIACKSFDRFFNFGEVPDFYSDFDFNSAVAYEKADGSLIRVWYNRVSKRWEISTRGMAFAEGEHKLGGTFREKVINSFGLLNEEEFQMTMRICTDEIDRSGTFVFEYTGPENRHVVRYASSEMVFLAVFWNVCHEGGRFESFLPLEEFGKNLRKGMNFRYPMEYPFFNVQTLVKMAEVLPNLQEGFVVKCLKTGKRMKIKNPAYVAVHHLRDNGGTPSAKRVTTLVLLGEADEYLNYFPEDEIFFRGPKEQLESLIKLATEAWNLFKDIPDQKSFALMVKELSFSGLLFEARKTKTDPVEVFNNLEINRKLKYFGF